MKTIIATEKIKEEKQKQKIDFSKPPGVGMWKDREDMKDSAKWVHDLRVKESNRTYSNK